MDFKLLNNYLSTESWPFWKQKFEIYLQPSEKDKSEEKVKIATLLACIGDDAIHVNNTIDSDKKSRLEVFLKQFYQHFVPQKVTAMETFKLNTMMIQRDDQTIEQICYRIKKQTQLCYFMCKNEQCKSSYKERKIRDRLVAGIKDKEAQLRMIREKDLDINKTIEYCKSMEVSKENIKMLNPDEKQKQQIYTRSLNVDVLLNIGPIIEGFLAKTSQVQIW